jgi:aldose 1-epimerase
MGVTKSAFGKLKSGEAIELYTLENKNGVKAKIMTYGALLTELWAFDKDGKLGEVTLGFSDLASYEKGHPFFGATVGRVANRIARGKFELGGKSYTLAVNNAPNHLHGGDKGWDKRVWAAQVVASKDGPSVKFSYVSKDGEEGYPGTVQASVTFTMLNESNTLRMDYQARSDKATPINMTNHAYFNLRSSGNILDHEVLIYADNYTPIDDTLIPTGKIESVIDTPLDFRIEHTVGERIAATTGEPNGYDHNFVLNSKGQSFTRAAKVKEFTTGRVLEVWTDQPGIQFYTGNFLDGTLKGRWGKIQKNFGFCLETQHFPDSINQPSFPSVVLQPGMTYKTRTEYRFLIAK